MIDLNARLLALGNPDLVDEDGYGRGLTLAVFLSAPLWALLGAAIEWWWP